MTPSRVFFVNRFYWPEEPATAQLLADLATSLATGGHDVTVITSRPADAAVPSRETREGVAIERVRSTRWGRRSLLGRVVDFATFYPAAFFRLLRLVRRGDQIVALTDPPLIGVVVWLVARLRGADLVHWVQDIYPEIAVQITGQRWPLLLRPLRNLAWRQARHCVVPGADMARTVIAAGVASERVTISPNWAPAGVTPPATAAVAALRREWDLEGKFVLAYSGNLGRVHDLDPLLDLAAALADLPAFVLLFVGGGAQRASLENAARARGLANVRFRPPQPRHQLAASLGVGDLHAVTLLPGAERYVFPSKLYGIAQVGRPVIFFGARESELARLLVTHGFGTAFARDEIPLAAARVRAFAAEVGALAAHGTAAHAFAAGGFEAAVMTWKTLMGAELAARHDLGQDRRSR